uniref:V-SNARE coiled-coil homology domain-containing protein n=1 Tax=Lactuca sativa TaxID=4236 RepID=A0A9R1V0M3_LACSA|nr:hypothetical protein LSAT_V11C700343640 [Lactuca sativa]
MEIHGRTYKDITAQWPYLNDALTRYLISYLNLFFNYTGSCSGRQVVEDELDETKIILHKTIYSILERCKKLDSLGEKSSDLNAASQVHL